MIKNCDVEGFQSGYEIDSSSNNARFCGFDLYLSSNGNTFIADSASGQAHGFNVENSNENTFDRKTTNNTASFRGVGRGFELPFGSLNYLDGNAASNDGYGFWLYGSDGSTPTQNTADNSSLGGPYPADGSG